MRSDHGTFLTSFPRILYLVIKGNGPGREILFLWALFQLDIHPRFLASMRSEGKYHFLASRHLYFHRTGTGNLYPSAREMRLGGISPRNSIRLA